MLSELPISFDSPRAMEIAATITGLVLLAAWVRRPAMPRLTLLCWLMGLLLLTLACGGITWNRPARQVVAVMVDLSPSTRTADYRDLAVLDRRIRELLRDLPYRVRYFASHTIDDPPPGPRLDDLPAEQTVYTPPAAAAVLLFSDCCFELPARSPPTYVVVDAGLDDTEDAAVGNLELRGNEAEVTVNNPGGSRRLTFHGAADPMPVNVPAGSMVISRTLAPGMSRVSAELSPGDAWPENDSLSAIVAAPAEFERWWVGHSDPGPPWRVFTPQDLPTDPADYLLPAIVVLDDVPASELGELRRRRLRQYVRDVGGGLMILGGERAFAAGDYQGTDLDAISPLASNPPQPTTHWVVLADASGSMSSDAGGKSRFDYVTGAIAQLLPRLPPQDVVSVGSFSDELRWWAQAKAVKDVALMTIPPAAIFPHGPTNLQPALESIGRSADGKMPVQLLVLSDFDTDIQNPDDLAQLLKANNVHLHLLAIGEGTALTVLRQISARTQGTVARQLDPARWAAAALELARAAGSNKVEHRSIGVSFEAEAAGLQAAAVSTWNHVWVKESATRLAEAADGSDTHPMAAWWNAGEGRALAAAFEPPPAQARGLAGIVARPPHDPRFRLTWQTGPRLRLVIDAADASQVFNDLQPRLELRPDLAATRPTSVAIPQTGPGRYEVSMPAPRASVLGTVRIEGRVIGQAAIAGRYAPEFDAIGNDHAAMNELARRSGGQVVTPDRSAPLDIRWPRQPVGLTSLLAMAGAAMIALGLAWWRIS